MADDTKKLWRLPGSIKGQDVKLGGSSQPVSSFAKTRLRRIVNKTPEVMVKLTGRTRGGLAYRAGHLKGHLDYITRNGNVAGETQDGKRIADRASLRALHDDWLLANAAESRAKNAPNATQSVSLMLSMPPGTPPDRVEIAARTWARETLGSKHDWIMARHDDTDHPHVHIAVRAVGRDGRRLAPGPEDLQQWRERFARELRRLGVPAEATPKQARGVIRKKSALAAYKAEQRGKAPYAQRVEKTKAVHDARTHPPPKPHDWSRDIQARQENIRRAYLGHADELIKGDAFDRQLASDIRCFVADMPVPLTRRQAMTVELRRVLEQQPGRETPPLAPVTTSRLEEIPRQEIPTPLPELSHSSPSSRGRG
jgi:type IV secretion system T-DNA border endonuclease VirD2